MSRIGRGFGAARRWSVAAAFTAVLVAAPAVADRLPATAPRAEPRALLARMLASEGRSYQGYAESYSALGLPEVREVGRLVDLLGETSRLRVWYDSADRWRVDTLTRTGERGSYGDGGSTWLWDADDRRVTRILGEPRVRLPRGADMLPPELGRRLARLVTTSDRVTAIRSRRVAGRAAQGVRVEPRAETTTVAHVDLWADPRTGLPLRVEVTPRGTRRPLLSTAFLEFDPSRPSGEVVTFEAPDDARLDVTTAGDLAARLDEQLDVPLPDSLAGLRKRATVARAAATYGEGFGVVAVIALPPRLAYRVRDRLVAPYAVELTEPYGSATVVTTPLVNGLLAFDPETGLGYAVAGAAPVATLRAVARDLVAG